MRLLLRLVPGDKAALRKMQKAIEKDKSLIVNHEWLLEKLQQMA
jgi:hypothetical protein